MKNIGYKTKSDTNEDIYVVFLLFGSISKTFIVQPLYLDYFYLQKVTEKHLIIYLLNWE